MLKCKYWKSFLKSNLLFRISLTTLLLYKLISSMSIDYKLDRSNKCKIKLLLIKWPNFSGVRLCLCDVTGCDGPTSVQPAQLQRQRGRRRNRQRWGRRARRCWFQQLRTTRRWTLLRRQGWGSEGHREGADLGVRSL